MTKVDRDPGVRERRSKARRTALVFGIVAVSVYGGYFVYRYFMG